MVNAEIGEVIFRRIMTAKRLSRRMALLNKELKGTLQKAGAMSDRPFLLRQC
jgi:hypothetical protein